MALLLAAVASGCKPSDSASSTQGSGNSPVAGKGAGGADKIRVGEYASLTGKEAAFGQSSHKGTLLAIDDINRLLGGEARLGELTQP